MSPDATALDPSAGPAEVAPPAHRRVLYVAYFFPPLGGVSVARTLAFVRHLPAAGWACVVLAPRGSAYPLRDVSGVDAIPPAVPVVRALSPEPQALSGPVRRLRQLVMAAISRVALRPPATSGAGRPGSPSSEPAPGRPPANRRSRWSPSSLRQIVFFPDDQIGWTPFAVAAGFRAARANRASVIFSTASPITSHLVAACIHRLTGLPWVAEFRDPWVGNVLAPRLPWLHRRLQRRVEGWVVAEAARVVFLSEETARDYVTRYPSLAERWRVVTNGYDVSELGTAAVRQKPAGDQPVRLVYTGTLERPAEAAAFFAGADMFARRSPQVSSRLTVEFVGLTSPVIAAIAAPYVASGPLRSMIRFTSFAPRATALDHVRTADACLTLLGDDPGMSQFLPGKLFDYIGLDAPVLAVVPEGEVRRVLEELDWGIVADPTPDGVADGLDRLVAGDYRIGRADPTGRFERRRLAAQLGAILDEASSEART